jgi:uncharacterized protein (TIGR02453 family)
MEIKDCTFRFNRDIRFSNNKNPYKENFGAFFSYGGKKGNQPGYYLHVSPKESFLAGGVWLPEAGELLSIRRYLVKNGNKLDKILKDKKFKKVFGELNTDYVLKRPPKGFYEDTPHIEFLKYKSFTVSSSLTLEQILKPGFGKYVDQHFKILKPYNYFLADAISAQGHLLPFGVNDDEL